MTVSQGEFSLIATAALWDQLEEHFSRSNLERLAFGYCSASLSDARIRLLLEGIALPGDDAYSRQDLTRVVLRAERTIPYLIRAKGAAALMDVHSHPTSEIPSPSLTDEKAADQQYDSIQGPASGAFLLRIIRSGNARIWAAVQTANGTEPLYGVYVHGPKGLHIIRPVNSFYTAPLLSAADKRSISVLGRDGVIRAKQLRVAVIGIGGVGSMVARLLAGVVGSLSLIDPDQLEPHGAPRLWYAGTGSQGAKVTLAKRMIKRAFPDLPVQELIGSFPSREADSLVRSADFVFVCPDHHTVRYAASHFAAKEMLPLIEVGCGGRMIDGKLSALGYHVRLQIPDGPCLVCNGLDTSRLEDPNTTRMKRSGGYIEDGSEVAGELGCLTTRAAADAVDMFLRYCTGYAEPLPTHLYSDVLNLRTLNLSTTFAKRPDCPICGESSAQTSLGKRPDILSRAADEMIGN